MRFGRGSITDAVMLPSRHPIQRQIEAGNRQPRYGTLQLRQALGRCCSKKQQGHVDGFLPHHPPPAICAALLRHCTQSRGNLLFRPKREKQAKFLVAGGIALALLTVFHNNGNIRFNIEMSC